MAWDGPPRVYTGRHAAEYDVQVDIVRTSYIGRHRLPIRGRRRMNLAETRAGYQHLARARRQGGKA